LITAYGCIEDAVKGIRNGATDYLEKPLSTDKLYKVVEPLLPAKH